MATGHRARGTRARPDGTSRTRRWIAGTTGVACLVLLWASPATAAVSDPGDGNPITNVQQNPDTGVIEVETSQGGLPAHYFSETTVSELFEQHPEYQAICAGGCEIDVINDVSSFSVSIPQPDFGDGGYAPTVGPSMPLPPAVSVESLACTAGSVVGFDAVAARSGTIATDYVQLIIEHRPFGDYYGGWTRLLTSGGDEMFEVAADGNGSATLPSVEVPASPGGQTQVRISGRAGRDPGNSEGDETIWGLWGAVPRAQTRPLPTPGYGSTTTTDIVTTGVVPGAWLVFEAPPCPAVELPTIVGVTPCLHPIVMQQNPTPVYHGHYPNQVRHATSVYEPMRTVRLRVEFTQGSDDGTNSQVVGWVVEAAGGYWYVTNPDQVNTQYTGTTGWGGAVRITETIDSPDTNIDLSLEWVYSSGYANGRSHGWSLAVTPILDSDGYVTAGMRTIASAAVTEATEFCTPTPDAPTQTPLAPTPIVECDVYTYTIFNPYPTQYSYPIARVTLDPTVPAASAGWEREARYVGTYVIAEFIGNPYISAHGSFTAYRGDDGLYSFSIERFHTVTVDIAGQYRHRRNIDGAWSLWSDWGATSAHQQHNLPTCPTTRPPAPATPPDPAPVLECGSGQFIGVIGTAWEDQAAADWRREAEYDLDYWNSAINLRQTLTATRDALTGEHTFQGPEDPLNTVDVRVRVRGRQREWTGAVWGPWSVWSAWSGWHTHTTPICSAPPPRPATPAPSAAPVPASPTLVCADDGNGGLIATASWLGQTDTTAYAEAYEVEWSIDRSGTITTIIRPTGPSYDEPPAELTTADGIAAGDVISFRVRAKAAAQASATNAHGTTWSGWSSFGAWSAWSAASVPVTCPVPAPVTPPLPPVCSVEDEPYTDTNGNGSWDAGEPFTDLNSDGSWTANLTLHAALYPAGEGEPYTDTNDNGSWDPGEGYTDVNGDGSWTADLGGHPTGQCYPLTIGNPPRPHPCLQPGAACVRLGS